MFGWSGDGRDPAWVASDKRPPGIALAALRSRWHWRSKTPATTRSPSAPRHTYLRVDEIAAVAIEGSVRCDFRGQRQRRHLHRQHDHDVRFDDETDRIYSATWSPACAGRGERRLAIEQDGFADAIVWNPGQRPGRGSGDPAAGRLAPLRLRREAGPVLQPVRCWRQGESWRGRQLLG